MSAFLVVGLLNFGGNIVGRIGPVGFDNGTDILAILFFEIDIFFNDGVVAIAENEKFRGDTGRFETSDLMGLAFFDKSGELTAI